jgi:glycosyltransferase involved in cell wall biosynthesis
MRAISELFDATTLVVPCEAQTGAAGLSPLTGNNLTVAPLSAPAGRRLRRKLALLWWLVRNAGRLLRAVASADAVHAPIPGDIGTFGMLLAVVMRKPLFVRHCGNWFVQKTTAEHFWRWFIERFAGGRNVMLATGGSAAPPSRNRHVRWIFSTSLGEDDLKSCHTRREAPLGSGRAPRLIIACRQDREKGTGKVIESLPLILRDFPGATLDVVGDGYSLGEFEGMAEALGVGERITFHGKVDHATVIRLFRRADLFCYPTAASEGFPKVVLEALACGLPVVTTRVSVLPELIGRGCGLLVEETGPETVARAVREILSDGEGYREMSLKACDTAREYSLERWGETIGALLCAAWGRRLRTDA